MSFPSQLVSPNGVTVAVGSAREHLTLRSQGYKTPEEVTAAVELAAAQAAAQAAQADLDSARGSSTTTLTGLKDELGDGGDPVVSLDGDPVAPKPPTGRTSRTK